MWERVRAHLAPHARQRLATVLGSHWPAFAARRRPCFKRSRAWAALFWRAPARRQPIAYACLAWRDKARALHYVCCTPFLWCHVALNFFFLLSENAHICTFQLFFFPKKGLGFIGFAIRNVLSINLPVIWTMSASKHKLLDYKILE